MSSSNILNEELSIKVVVNNLEMKVSSVQSAPLGMHLIVRPANCLDNAVRRLKVENVKEPKIGDDKSDSGKSNETSGIIRVCSFIDLSCGNSDDIIDLLD